MIYIKINIFDYAALAEFRSQSRHFGPASAPKDMTFKFFKNVN